MKENEYNYKNYDTIKQNIFNESLNNKSQKAIDKLKHKCGVREPENPLIIKKEK